MITLLFALFLSVATFVVVQHPVFGQSPKKERLNRMQQSPNFKNGKFHNLEETPVMHPDASYWKLLKQQFSEGVNRVPGTSLPVVKRELNGAKNDEQLLLTWFGHSTILVQLAGKKILIDPVFSKRASPFQFIGPKHFPGTNAYSAADFPEIDFLLISHDHFDHLDHQTLKDLAPKVKQFMVPLGVGAHLEKWGVNASKIKELDWWDEVKLDTGILLAATPARHFSGRSLFNRNETLWASYVLKTDSQAVYLGGDSGYGTHFKAIGEKYGPFTITTLECGQYNSYWPNIHMMPEETAQAHLDLKGEALLPIHWAKFKLALHPWTEPVERLSVKGQGLGIKVLMPEIGRQISLSEELPSTPWWRYL